MSITGPTAAGTAGQLPVVNQATEPSWVRRGSAETQRDYAAALAFERTLVEQLSKSLTPTGEEGEEGGGEGGSGSMDAGMSQLSSMLPQAFSSLDHERRRPRPRRRADARHPGHQHGPPPPATPPAPPPSTPEPAISSASGGTPAPGAGGMSPSSLAIQEVQPQDRALAAEVLAHLDAQIHSARSLLAVVLEQGAAIRAREVAPVVRTAGILRGEMGRRQLLEEERSRLLAQ